MNFEVLIWCDAHQLERRRTVGAAIQSIKAALDAAEIEMPSEILALQATASFAAALRGDAVTPGGSVASDTDRTSDVRSTRRRGTMGAVSAEEGSDG